MSKYWIFMNDRVAGPYSVEQLIRLRGFSRQSQVCPNDDGGSPQRWMSPSEIPELFPIFKVVDQIHEPTMPKEPVKAAPKPAVPRPAPRHSPRPAAAAPTPASASNTGIKIFLSLLTLFLLAGSGTWWFQKQARLSDDQMRGIVRNLVETRNLPADSQYPTLQAYFSTKGINAQWQYDHMPTGVYDATVSWSGDGPGGSTDIYVFEVNTDAQSVRGVNSAAVRLLSEGFPRPAPKPEPVVKKKPSDAFMPAVENHLSAIDNGDFGAVWSLFSERKRSEMLSGGISEAGYVKLQTLTHGLEAGVTQTVLKTHKITDTQQLVLIRQMQPPHPDVFIKQLWIYEKGDWKLDDEEKKSMEQSSEPATTPDSAAAGPSASTPSGADGTANSASPTTAPSATGDSSAADSKNSAAGNAPTKPPVMSLPGLSN